MYYLSQKHKPQHKRFNNLMDTTKKVIEMHCNNDVQHSNKTLEKGTQNFFMIIIV